MRCPALLVDPGGEAMVRKAAEQRRTGERPCARHRDRRGGPIPAVPARSCGPPCDIAVDRSRLVHSVQGLAAAGQRARGAAAGHAFLFTPSAVAL